MNSLLLNPANSQSAEISMRYRKAPEPPYWDVILRYFHSEEFTIDIGCGEGRDTAWLKDMGFPVVGVDPSSAMLNAARKNYPHLDLRSACLPDLDTVQEAYYSNLLCASVLMHIPDGDVSSAVRGLSRVLRVGGRMVLTFKQAEDNLASAASPFTAMRASDLSGMLELYGCATIVRTWFFDPDTNQEWTLLVAEKRVH